MALLPRVARRVGEQPGGVDGSEEGACAHGLSGRWTPRQTRDGDGTAAFSWRLDDSKSQSSWACLPLHSVCLRILAVPRVSPFPQMFLLEPVREQQQRQQQQRGCGRQTAYQLQITTAAGTVVFDSGRVNNGLGRCRLPPLDATRADAATGLPRTRLGRQCCAPADYPSSVWSALPVCNQNLGTALSAVLPLWSAPLTTSSENSRILWEWHALRCCGNLRLRGITTL